MNQPLILLVDDEADFREIFSVKLESSDFKVVTAASGKEAFEKIKDFSPDLVLLDVRMPEEDGVSVLARLKADPQHVSLKVVFLTNLGDPGAGGNDVDQFAAKQTGALGYLRKDQDLDKLVDQVKGYLFAT